MQRNERVRQQRSPCGPPGESHACENTNANTRSVQGSLGTWNGRERGSVVREEGKDPPLMTSTIRLGRIRGIEIGIHWSLLVIGSFLAFSLATGILPEIVPDAGGSYWAAAILATALFFASVLAHELAHSFVAQ